MTIRTSTSLASRANRLFLDRKLGCSAVVEVAEGYGDSDFHVRAVALPAAVEVAASAEETREEVEGVVVLGLSATAALVLFYALVAVLVVYAAGLFVDEDVIRFCNCDEFPMSGFVAAGRWLVSVARGSVEGEGEQLGLEWTYGFLSGWNFLLRDRYAFLIWRSEASFLRPRSCGNMLATCSKTWNCRGTRRINRDRSCNIPYRNPRRKEHSSKDTPITRISSTAWCFWGGEVTPSSSNAKEKRRNGIELKFVNRSYMNSRGRDRISSERSRGGGGEGLWSGNL